MALLRMLTVAATAAMRPLPALPCKASCDHCVDVAWLECRARQIIEGCRMPIDPASPLRKTNNATLLYTPDATHAYGAQWTRDFQYTVAGASELMDEVTVKRAVRYTFAGQRADGCMPDRVEGEGNSVMSPDGYLRVNHSCCPASCQYSRFHTGCDAACCAPRAHQTAHDHAWDDMPFAALLLASTVRAWPDKQLFCELEPQARKALDFVNRSANHLVYNSETHPNCTYGFTDQVAKTGNLLICSLLYVDASRQLAALSKQYGCGDTAQYAREAAEVGGAIDALKDPAGQLWFAATLDNRVQDVWGTAYLVALNLSTAAKRQAAMDDMVSHPADFFERGQVRSMPKGKYWTRCCFNFEKSVGCPDSPPSPGFPAGIHNGPLQPPFNGTNRAAGCPAMGTYQNGAFWATPLGYVTQALLATGHKAFATQLLAETTDDFKEHGIFEDVGVAPMPHGVLNYTASATSAFGAAKLLLLKTDDRHAPAGPASPPRPRSDSCSAGAGWAHTTVNIQPDIARLPAVTSASACCAACVRHSGCRAWTANASGCGLKASSWEKGGHPGSTSGAVTAPRLGPPPGPPPPPPGPLPPPPTPAPGATCELSVSGPIKVSADNQIVENLQA